MSKLILLLLSFFIFGCAKTNPTWLVYIENTPNQMLYITVDRDGELAYRGGVDFIAGRDTWKTKINSEEIEKIELILNSSEDKKEESDLEAKVIVDGVQIVSEEKQESLIATLNRLVSNRFDFILDGLPKSSADVLIERSIKVIESD